MDGEETQTISPRSSECSQKGEIDDSLFTQFFQDQKFRKKFMDLSQRRRRDRIQLGSRVILKLCSVIDDAKDINNKKDVANDVVIFIDAIKEYLVQTVLKQDLNDLRECIYHRPPDDEKIFKPQLHCFQRVVEATTRQLLIQSRSSLSFPKTPCLVSTR